MKKLAAVVLAIIIVAGIVYFKRGTIINKEKIISSFEVPSENIPDCYPIKLVDYREVSKNNDEMMIFCRTVWSEKNNSESDHDHTPDH